MCGVSECDGRTSTMKKGLNPVELSKHEQQKRGLLLNYGTNISFLFLIISIYVVPTKKVKFSSRLYLYVGEC